MFLACKMILRKSYNAFTWFLWNQNRKSCILHKPANYFILITAGFFTPQSLLATKSFSATIWELTHYSKLSPEYLTSLSTKSVCSENTVFGDETARRQKQVCRWRPRLFLNEITAQMLGIKLWAASRAWLPSFSDLNCFRLQGQWGKGMTGGHTVLLLTKFNSGHHCPTSKLLGHPITGRTDRQGEHAICLAVSQDKEWGACPAVRQPWAQSYQPVVTVCLQAGLWRDCARSGWYSHRQKKLSGSQRCFWNPGMGRKVPTLWGKLIMHWKHLAWGLAKRSTHRQELFIQYLYIFVHQLLWKSIHRYQIQLRKMDCVFIFTEIQKTRPYINGLFKDSLSSYTDPYWLRGFVHWKERTPAQKSRCSLFMLHIHQPTAAQHSSVCLSALRP